MEKNSIIRVGGSVDGAIKGDFTINIPLIFKEAWQKTLFNKRAINSGLIFIFSLATLLMILTMNYMGGIEKIYKDPQALLLIQLIISVIIWPFLVGVEMMGIIHAIGAKSKFTLIFAFLKRASWVIVCGLMTSILVSVGFQLFILPGIFLAVVFSLTFPLVIEKQFSPVKALVVSLQSLRFQWIKFFSIYLILMGILVISALPLVLLAQSNLMIIALVFFIFCLSYLAPLFYNIKGILYRDVFGVSMFAVDKNLSLTNDVFLA